MDFIIPVIAVLLVVFILSLTSRKKDKVDKGFTFNYYRLSYRRKMLRTFINIPIMVLLVILVYRSTDWKIGSIVLLGLLLFVAFLVQLIYNYRMWKRNET
ncbi:ATPase [Virgibacillus xinjiangensis]|uniref:ATPase n=1 Tax=Virgibacillus xinjiangensis TaxID=393090 RepID=A0ABV7CTD9_9BACI